jgi:hypothetical protein
MSENPEQVVVVSAVAPADGEAHVEGESTDRGLGTAALVGLGLAGAAVAAVGTVAVVGGMVTLLLLLPSVRVLTLVALSMSDAGESIR